MIEAMLYKRLNQAEVDCHLCCHQCRIAEGKFGICGMRENRGGTLYTHAYGRTIAANVDPIEKKPLYHFFPGTESFSIATMGCNFKCGFCQNWQLSQTSARDGGSSRTIEMSPERIVQRAKSERCQSISYTYTEPTIFFEYAYDTAKLAKADGLFNVFVTNGFMTAEAVQTIQPYLDACNVDLKSFRKDFYKKICHGRLDPVLKTIRLMKSLQIWVEVTTLVVPGSNDDETELRDIARFIAEVDADIPWHVSRFHPDFEFDRTAATPLSLMQAAYEIGKAEGLRYVYLGNVPGESRDTRCPHCLQPVIRRDWRQADVSVSKEGTCLKCGGPIAGVFRA